jgi:hypothetical protein
MLLAYFKALNISLGANHDKPHSRHPICSLNYIHGEYASGMLNTLVDVRSMLQNFIRKDMPLYIPKNNTYNISFLFEDSLARAVILIKDFHGFS